MNKTVFNAVVAVLIAVAVFSIASAQAGGQRGRWPGGPGFGGPRLGGFARLADLTDEQRTQIQAIVEEDRASRQGPPAVVTLHRQLEAELLADSPDDQKIDTLRQRLLQAQGEEVSRQITLQRKIASVLTAEQRAKARERLAQAPRGRPEHGVSR
jgi:Spy/CpxP family protein refolding chaperone